MSQSLDEALELIKERARNDPEPAGALRTILAGIPDELTEPTPKNIARVKKTKVIRV